MRAQHRYLHAFGGFEGVFGPLSAATIGHPLGWNPAFCAFAFRVLSFESVSSRPDGSISCSSRPYGSFSCRFCGFQEGAFSMASYRSFRGSKGTLGPCRAVCLWRVGLESCWGSAVSHPYGSFSCRFCGFQEGAFSMASSRSFRGSKGTLGRPSGFGGLGWNPAGALPLRMRAHHLYLHGFSGFEGAVWAPVCRLESMGLCRVACVPTTGTSMLLAVSKVLFRHLVCSHIGHALGWNPAGALPFRMRAHHRYTSMLLAVSKVLFGHLVCSRFACVPTTCTSML